tara:strand:+ start:123 stop:326 length:204 start_codon:yes stop_codon:yes gene_type:complete
MAGYKAASGKPKPRNLKRTVDGEEIKPCLYINSNGKKMMAGSLNGEICKDEFGKVLPLSSIKHNGIL